MTAILERLLRRVSRRHRQAAAKRRLERLLQINGISRRLAREITHDYFNEGTP